MTRLIDADAIEYSPLDDIYNNDVMVAYKESIENIPTVDAQSEIDRLKRLGFSMMDTIMGMMEMVNNTEPVRHGNWKPFDEDEYTCSVCGNIFVTMDGEHPLSNEFKYCPFCGAKMDAQEKDDGRKTD